jgi:hypothetical protein
MGRSRFPLYVNETNESGFEYSLCTGMGRELLSLICALGAIRPLTSLVTANPLSTLYRGIPVAKAKKMPGLVDMRTFQECKTCEDGPSYYHQGLDTFRVPMYMFALNRDNVIELMPSTAHGVILMAGGQQKTRYDTDHEPLFR